MRHQSRLDKVYRPRNIRLKKNHTIILFAFPQENVGQAKPFHCTSWKKKKYCLPQRPTVVVCIVGFDPEYLQSGIDDSILPHMASFLKSGFHVTADCAMPSLTNPSNLSIITGFPTSVHGVSGNYYLDKETGQEHMIVDDSMIRGTTILAQMADAGVRVAAITAKDKLRRIIQHGLSPKKGSICFSAQCANECT